MLIHDAIVAKLQTLSAVTALTTIIRALQFDERDELQSGLGIAVQVDNRKPITEESTFISGKSDLVRASVVIACVSGNHTKAWNLAEAVRVNGTDPGTGLGGIRVRTGGLNFDAVWEEDSSGYIPNEDGSDSGLFAVHSTYTVMYYQVI